MAHDSVLAALQRACPRVAGRPDSGVSLVAQFRDERMGLDDSVGTLVFLTDWHVVPDGSEDDWPVGRVCRHGVARLQTLVEELAALEQEGGDLFAACHIGDFVDLWRTLTEDDSVKKRVEAVAGGYRMVIQRMRDDLQALFIAGNHDARIRQAGDRYFGSLVKDESVMVSGQRMPNLPYTQRLTVMHGHQFDTIENVVPEAVREFFVRTESKRRRPRPPAGSPPPARNPYEQTVAEEGTQDDEFLNPSLSRTNLLPLGAARARVGRVLEHEFRPDENPLHTASGVPGDRSILEKFYTLARDRCWVTSTETERTSVLVIGHTHLPRIVWGNRADGSIFVLMDCGSWRGKKRLSRDLPHEVFNGQVGVIADNDLRIYQLTYP
jgi:UDP-2,3-diacylglucosamine pyrophosphatase LpxH